MHPASGWAVRRRRWLLSQLLAKRDALWLTESHGGGRYIRVKERGATRIRFRDKCLNLADGTVSKRRSGSGS